MNRDAMRNIRKIACHLNNLRLKPLIKHLLQLIILPPRFSYMMIGENLTFFGDKKAGSKNVQMHFRPASSKADKRIVLVVSLWLSIACKPRIVQLQSHVVVAEANHDVNQADARFIVLNNGMCEL